MDKYEKLQIDIEDKIRNIKKRINDINTSIEYEV